MRVAKCHPQLGWLRLEARDYSRSLDRLLLERDRLDDPNHSGPAQAYLDWMLREELPQLAQHPRYREQIEAHVDDLVSKQAQLAQQIEQQAPALLQQLQALEAQVQQLREVMWRSLSNASMPASATAGWRSYCLNTS